jgi:hypothetical protein
MTKSKSLSLSNSAKPKSFGKGSGDLGASIGLGANMETLRYQNQAALPNQNETNAQLFSDIGKGLNGAGGRPRGTWQSIASGVMKGLEHGSKSKAVAEKKENFDKYENVMNYLQETNNAAIEQNQWYEKREGARREMMPQVLSYMDNIDKLDPQSQRIMAQDILAQYGEAIGEDFKLSSIDGSNPFLMTIQSSKGQQLFDLRSMFAGDDAVQQAIAMKMPEYQMKLQQERQDKEREFKIKEDDNAVKREHIAAQYPASNIKAGGAEETFTFGDQTYNVGSLGTLEKNARAEYQKTVHKENDAITKNNLAIKAIESMEEVFARNPNIGSKMINMLDNPDGVDSWMNIFGRKLSGQDLTDMEILRKATNDLNLDTILGISGKAATDLLKKAIQAASPSGKMTKGGFDNVSSKWKAKAFEANQLAQAKYKAMLQGKSLMPNAYLGKSAEKEEVVSPQSSDDSPLAQFGRRVQ